MLKIKTLSDKKIKDANRFRLIFYLFYYTFIFVLMRKEQIMGIVATIFAIIAIAFVFFRSKKSKPGSGYLEIDDNEVRIFEHDNKLSERLPINNNGSLHYHPRKNWLKIIALMVDYPTLTIHSEGKDYTFNVLLDSKLMEKRFRERLNLA